MLFPEKRHPAYDHMDSRQRMGDRHGTQAGDPKKGAKAMYELADMAMRDEGKDGEVLSRAVIGSDAHTAIMKKIKGYEENYLKYKDLAESTDVEGYVRPQ